MMIAHVFSVSGCFLSFIDDLRSFVDFGAVVNIQSRIREAVRIAKVRIASEVGAASRWRI